MEEALIDNELRVNDRIRANEVRVVAPDGTQVGVKRLEEALWLAEQLGLDLVEVAPQSSPPVCRLMDYGKWKYEQSVRQREARKKQTRTVIKEVKFKPKIDHHDFDVKRRRVEEFLGEGDKVKVTMMFRGREVTHPELGERLLRRLVKEVDDLAVVEAEPRLEGRNMSMMLAPARRLPRDEPVGAAEAGAAENGGD
ncbi:MAG: translation initiation factor IF-3 [Actinomycetota bacterium]|nr:translation initiation factor IF-3 [Actinomycetota bacterium]